VQLDSSLVGRVRRIELSPAAFRRVALVSAFMLWLIIWSGATVRLTGSGLGCEHWPGCTAGDPLPAKNYHAFIEFSNRLVSAVTIFATLVAWLAARATPGLRAGAQRLALATFIGTLAQAPLGALTVYSGLHPLMVMTHLLLALVVLGWGVVLYLEALALEHGVTESRLPLQVRRGALVLAAALLALVVSGTVATAAGPHPGSSNDVRRLWNLHAAVYVHVRATAVFGLLFLAGLVYLWRHRARWPMYFEGAVVLLFLFLLQMGIGELQYRTKLPWWLVLVHVAVAAAVWSATVALVTLVQRPLRRFASTDA
jgi:cytochrome c oxidase assembly protein subunit 15